jgi:hypothetical protein
VARRNAQRGLFDGGPSRWLEPAEARALFDTVLALPDAAAFAEWLRSEEADELGARMSGAIVVLSYRSRLGVLQMPLAESVGREIVSAAADRRREAALRRFMTQSRMPYTQREAFRRKVERCVTCGGSLPGIVSDDFRPIANKETIPHVSRSRFYCSDHADDEAAELAALLA